MAEEKKENEFVADARLRLGMTQKEVAQQLGVTIRTLSLIETGERPPSKKILVALQRLMVERGLAANPCSPAENELLQMYRQLPPDNQERITGIMRSLTAIQTQK